MVRRRTREGFTLIEILVTTVVLSLLTAIAVPRYSYVKEKAYVVTMKSDLRNFMLAEELYYSEHKAYTTDTAALKIRMSSHVTAVITYNKGYGLYASASHEGTTRTCEVEVGGGFSTSPGNRPVDEGVVVCTGEVLAGSSGSSGGSGGGSSGGSGGGSGGGGGGGKGKP